MSMTQKGNNLNKFQTDPSITVFLLSLRSGAVGLTLTAANHLFLLDPSFNSLFLFPFFFFIIILYYFLFVFIFI